MPVTGYQTIFLIRKAKNKLIDKKYSHVCVKLYGQQQQQNKIHIKHNFFSQQENNVKINQWNSFNPHIPHNAKHKHRKFETTTQI